MERGAQGRVEDLTVVDTQSLPCGDARCDGTAAGVYGGGELALTRFTLGSSALAGLQIAYGSTQDDPDMRASVGGSAVLVDGTIRDNVIGVNVQNEKVDVDALIEGVRFVNNTRNIDSTALPVPHIPVL
jgi:hypothetical protein